MVIQMGIKSKSNSKNIYETYISDEGKWTDILGYSPVVPPESVVRKDQAYFMIGMAIHATMDSYAHRGRVKGVPYNGSQADDIILEGNYTQAQKNAFCF